MPRIESVDFFYLSMPEVEDIGDGSQDALVVRVSAGGCRLGRVRGLAARLDRQLRHADVAQRLPSGRDSVLGQKLDDIARHPGDRRRGRGTQPGRAAGAAHLFGHRDRAVGSAGQAARSAGLVAARRRQGLSEAALCLAPLRRHAAGNAGEGARGRAQGYRAAKFGWGPFGRARSAKTPTSCMRRARGWGRRAGSSSMPARSGWRMWSARHSASRPWWKCGPNGSRSPSSPARCKPISRSRHARGKVKLAGGEGAHNVYMANDMIDMRRPRLRADRCGPHRRHRARPRRVADYARRRA